MTNDTPIMDATPDGQPTPDGASADAQRQPARGTPPALTARVWGVLLRNEWFKTRRRRAFWVTLGFFAFIGFMEHFQSFRAARRDVDRTYSLTEAWSAVFSSDSVIFLIFASIALIMLVSSEFTWRTARQNVIDGLSKTNWFWGKVMLLPILGFVFLAVKVGLGGLFGALGTDFAAFTGPAVPGSVFLASGGLLLAFFCLGSLALLCATTIRNSGPAMAVWFFWIIFGEQLMPAMLGQLFEGLRPALGQLPFSNAQRLLSFASYDATAYQRLVDVAEAAGEAVPQFPDVGMALWVAALWTVLFVGTSYVLFRRRDL